MGFAEAGRVRHIFALPLEKCQSGRMGLIRNQVCLHGHRGFESLLLRRLNSPFRKVRAFSCGEPQETVYRVHEMIDCQ